MIRRDMSRPDGTSAWLLIPQISHAHLAGALSAAWRGPQFALFEPAGELQAAIMHHDDGWKSWDAEPGVDPDTGQPANFTEMLLGESLAIWRHSIADAKQFGHLAAFAVAGHFCALLRRFDSWKESQAKRLLAEKFLTYHDRQMIDWLSMWQSEDRTGRSTATAETAISWLQFFDALSLWFCTASRTAPESFVAPGGTLVTFTPLANDRIAVDPWPWPLPSLELKVVGQSVPAEPYADAKALAAAPHQEVALAWRLEPHVKPLAGNEN